MADWREGEAILWAGTNLAQKAEPEIVEITKSVTSDGGISYDAATSVNSTIISTNAFKSSVGNRQMKLAIKVKTGSTGANIECENLTAALGTIDNQSSPELTYDDDGNLYQKWTVSLNASAAKNAKDNSTPLVFKIYNQLDSEKQITLQLNPGIDPDDLQYGDIIYDDCTIVHLGEAKPASGNAVGVVVYKSDTPTDVCEAGVESVDGSTVAGKALVMALNEASASQLAWATANNDHDNTLFPNGTDVSAIRADMKGYAKTKQMATHTDGCSTHSHPAAEAAWNYHTNVLSLCSDDYLSNSTGWFMPSLGQWVQILENTSKNGDANGANKDASSTYTTNNTTQVPKSVPNANSLLSWAGGTQIANYSSTSCSYHTSSERDASTVFNLYLLLSNALGIHVDANGDVDDVKTYGMYVRPILAY